MGAHVRAKVRIGVAIALKAIALELRPARVRIEHVAREITAAVVVVVVAVATPAMGTPHRWRRLCASRCRGPLHRGVGIR